MRAKYCVRYVSGPTQAECHPELPMKKVTRRRFRGIFIPRWCPQGMGTCEGSATRRLERLSRGSFDFARRLASLRMTLHSLRGADQVQDWRVSRSGRLATDRKAVQRRGPGRVVLGSKPQLATAKQLVRWADKRKTAKELVSWAPRADCKRNSYLGGRIR